MGATGSELKRVRQSTRNNLRNRHYKSMMKNSIKKVLKAEKNDASNFLKQAISTIDRVCGKGIIHKNRASHQKSKLTKYVNNL
mgnify:CR=1 FL=1